MLIKGGLEGEIYHDMISNDESPKHRNQCALVFATLKVHRIELRNV